MDEIYFSKKNRFLFENNLSPSLSKWVTSVKFNYFKKEFEVEILEAGDFYEFHEFVDNLVVKKLITEWKFTEYKGNASLRFTDADLIDHEVGFDYAKSDATTHKFKFNYREKIQA